MVDLVDAGRDPLDKLPAGFRQPHATSMAFEQEDAKFILQCLDAVADAGLGGTECVCGVTEAQIFGDRQCLNQ